eukprot:gb/GFBE01037357.1/.p1 GENE.gb/GFBE01037357.1/~~gb/GFBE01037357.1/.p1  ORF type:complete len:239 (+),score=44.55 gb/GFBE01037357.1/:1-717(+)
MVIVSKFDEQKPPGGSNFGGHFSKTAFASYVFPRGKQLERDGTQRLHHREQREVARLVDPDVCQKAALHFAYAPNQGRLAKNFSQIASAPKKPGAMKGSSSSPALMVEVVEEPPEEIVVEQEASRPESAASQRSSAVVEDLSEFAAAQAMNSRWYPHPSLNRGTLKLNPPAALGFGVDPLKDTGHQCPFWEGKKHRFKDVQSLPSATLQTPAKSMRWKSEEVWNNQNMHASLKITHQR